MSIHSEDDSTRQLNGSLAVTEEQEGDATDFTQDEVDSLPKKLAFRWYEGLAIVLSIILYVLDTVSDIGVAYVLYNPEDMLFFGLTVAFIVVPNLTMTLFSLNWYIADAKVPKSPPRTTFTWVIRGIFLVLQLGPVLRYIDSLIYGILFVKEKDKKKAKQYFLWMSYEDADAALLRLFESFMEAAPQLVLQIYILASPGSPKDSFTVNTQLVTCAISLGSLSWSLASQQRTMRISLHLSQNMSWPGTIVQTMWFLFMLASRMLTLGLFASRFPVHLAVICVFRWLIMTIWIQTMNTDFCNSKIQEFFYRCVLGLVFLFCYFNPENSPTRWRYFFFYLYTLTENAILIGVWFTWVDPDLWYKDTAVYAVFLSFFIGLCFMIIYYLLLHPTNNIQIFGWCNFEAQPKPDLEPPTSDTDEDDPPFTNGMSSSPMKELKVTLPHSEVAAQGQTLAHSSNPNLTNPDNGSNILTEVYPNGTFGTPV